MNNGASFYSGVSSDQGSEIRDHKTEDDSLIAVESPIDQYLWLWEEGSHVSPVFVESPRSSQTSSSGGRFGSIGLHNNWPSSLSNSSIFPWLLPYDDNTLFIEFYKFVQDWYQSACAIVYHPNNGNPQIIGSGSLIDNTCVVTARHIFNGISENELFVRFYKYSVSRTDQTNMLQIREEYLDMPVSRKITASNGLDLVTLIIPSLRATEVASKYMKVLPIRTDLVDRNLPRGHYAMFHFSERTPQISIGEIRADSSISNLHNDISIQAGNGASGSTIIFKSFDSISGVGISIYRLIDNGSVNRRIISFSELQNLRYDDNISSPYINDPNFSVVPTNPLHESGYEFIQYTSNPYTINSTDRPSNKIYSTLDNQSNHHIIPAGDLLYLWDYFHTLHYQEVLNIKKEAKKKRNIYSNKKRKEYFNYTKEISGSKDSRERARTEKKAMGVAVQNKFDSLYEKMRDDKLKEKYSDFLDILNDLCPLNYNDRTWFCWAFWNLFQGWKRDYRTDDPSRDGNSSDYSEKIRPSKFSPRLWACLKDEDDGLYRRIQDLKNCQEPEERVENSLLNCLTNLRNEWQNHEQTIHPYDSEEWEESETSNNHPTYRVKSS